MKQILMCPPTKFQVSYEINVHMEGQIGTTDKFQVVKQWSDLRNALVSAGADVVVCPEPPDYCPDAVFMANAGLIFKDTFIPSQFKHEERRVEEPFFRNWFNEKGFEESSFSNYEMSPEEHRPRITFEGAGDALFSADRKTLWMGYGFRTHSDAKHALDWIFEWDEDVIVRPLKLVDPRWYHLDTCFCPLDNGDVLWYPNAFDEYSRDYIETWYPGSRNIKVSEEDALAFACNSISVGRHIVMPQISDDLLFELVKRGFQVSICDMSQFLRSGGACKCLTLEVCR
jgi:N-dimethylarginine dimethylaminohydrolase